MAHAVVVDDVDRRPVPRSHAPSWSRPAPLGVVVQADDRARVDAGRPQQLVAILACGPTASARAAGRRTPVRRARASGGRRSRAGSARHRCPGPGRSARRGRSTDAGPCAASRRSAMRRASAPRAGSGRRARRPGASSGRSRRTTLAGWRASRRACSSGPMTSYGGATTAARSSIVGRIEAQGAKRTDLGHGTFRRAARGPTAAGRWHRTIRTAATRPCGSGPARAALTSRNFRTG